MTNTDVGLGTHPGDRTRIRSALSSASSEHGPKRPAFRNDHFFVLPDTPIVRAALRGIARQHAAHPDAALHGIPFLADALVRASWEVLCRRSSAAYPAGRS